jgi:hypothetical protein
MQNCEVRIHSKLPTLVQAALLVETRGRGLEFTDLARCLYVVGKIFKLVFI